MQIYAIKAYEETYRGLHGIVSYAIIEGNFLDACDIGRDMSYDLMESHGGFYESFSLKASEEGLEGEGEEFDNYINECYEENIAYEIYEVIGRDDEDIDELDAELARNPDEFITKYCKPV